MFNEKINPFDFVANILHKGFHSGEKRTLLPLGIRTHCKRMNIMFLISINVFKMHM